MASTKNYIKYLNNPNPPQTLPKNERKEHFQTHKATNTIYRCQTKILKKEKKDKTQVNIPGEY